MKPTIYISSFGLFSQALDPPLADKIDQFIETLRKYKSGDTNFTLIVEDISGNSFVENPYAPKDDPDMITTQFERSKEENEKLGLYQQHHDDDENDGAKAEKDITEENGKSFIYLTPTICSN